MCYVNHCMKVRILMVYPDDKKVCVLSKRFAF